MAIAQKNIVILISGGGSNMAVIARTAEKEGWRGRWGVQVAAVISNKAGAGGLELARGMGIATAVGSENERTVVTRLDRLLKFDINMQTIVIVGNRSSKRIGKWFITAT